MHPILPLLPLLFQLASPLLLGRETDSRLLKPLCDLGCECPVKGQSPIFLDCGRKGIALLPPALQLLPPLSAVSFEGNALVVVEGGTFAEAGGVRELDLSLNRMSNLADSALAPFASLAVLKLSHNRLGEVRPGMLQGLADLRVLELGHNALRELSLLAFRETPRLQEVRLQDNPLFDLPEDLFSFLPKLERLDLQETGLVSLPASLFAPTPRLSWLSLSDNAFETVPGAALREAGALATLDLSGNDFAVLAEGSFLGLERLSLLYLNHLPDLLRVERGAFAGLTALKTLSCSYNPRLEHVDREAFGALNSSRKTPPRERLYLRQNALRTLSSPLEAAYWSAMSFVDFGDNPWRCDCNVKWMTRLRREIQMKIECESPSHLRGRVLSGVQTEELRCEHGWPLVTTVLVVSSLAAFGLVLLAASAVVCSRTPLGLKVRARCQFAYAQVAPKTDAVDLEWDPSADA